MIIEHSIYDLPIVPAVYLMYGGRKQDNKAYVGMSSDLRDRMKKHFVLRSSSVSTGTSATGINPDYITEVVWWEHERFKEEKGKFDSGLGYDLSNFQRNYCSYIIRR